MGPCELIYASGSGVARILSTRGQSDWGGGDGRVWVSSLG